MSQVTAAYVAARKLLTASDHILLMADYQSQLVSATQPIDDVALRNTWRWGPGRR